MPRRRAPGKGGTRYDGRAASGSPRETVDDDRLILDRYRPLADLGRGAHGRVTLAYDTRMARRVAIKHIPLTRAGLERLAAAEGLVEARTSAMLNHPNVVTVYDWDADDHEAYLIMEAVDGASLADLLDQVGALTPAETAAVVGDVAEALAFAHTNGVLHLDIKPANILVTRDGFVKVADFGIARLTDLAGVARVSEGTPGFMPPEQITGGPLDERTDVWALGALTYEMLTGDNPFAASAPSESLRLATEAELRPPSGFDRSLGPAVDDVVYGALAPSPEDRYRSIVVFADHLLAQLPEAATGRSGLADLAESIRAEEDPDAAEMGDERVSQWDFVADGEPWLRRVAAGLASLALAWSGFAGTPLRMLPAVVGTGLVATAGFAAPGLGLGLALLVLVVGIGLQIGWVAALLFAPVFAGLWWVGGRRGSWGFIAPLYAPALGMARLAPVGPPLFGFFMEPLHAAGASALGAALTMVASAASGYGAPLLKVDPGLILDPWATIAAHDVDFSVLAQPATVAVVAGWAGAGALAAAIARGGGRPRGLAAVLAACGVLLGTYLAWSATGAFAWPGTELLVQLGFSLFLSACVALFGAPPDLGAE